MSQGTPDIRVLVGVDGGASIDGRSGQLISQELSKIAKSISAQKAPQVAFTVNTQLTSQNIIKQLNSIVKGIQLNPIKLNIQTNSKDLTLANQHGNSSSTIAQKFISQFEQLGNGYQSLNAAENYANKLGKSELLTRIPELRSNLKTLTEEVNIFLKKIGGLDNLGKHINDDQFKVLKLNIENCNKAISNLKQVSMKDNPLFVKNERIAKNARDISDFALSLKKFEMVNNKFKGNSGAAAEFEQIKKALESLQYRASIGKNISVDLDKLKKKTNDWKLSLEQAGLTGQTFLGKLQTQMAKLGIYFSASLVMMRGIRQVKEMIANVTNLDTAMTELKKVTDETDITYSKFLDNAETRAKNIGASLTDTIMATVNFARLGYTLSEAEQISDAALIYKNVGDGINDINAASESVISTMKAFGIEASNAMSIVDRFNEVGNNFAISSQGVGDALKRSASALATAGNSIDESIALIVGANAVVQDPDVVGTALKTAALRLTSSRGKLEELGEDAEGAAESVTKLQTQLLNLTKGKVDIMLNKDNFKSTYQILLEMSKVWDKMSQKDQMDALELMFGKRGANVGSSIITNMADAENALKTSMNSAGSAMAENEKVLESIQGKMAQFKAQYEALSNTIFNSDFIKGAIDTGTGFLGFLDNIIKNLGTIPALATVAAGAISAFSNKGWLKIMSDKRTNALCNLVETRNELITIGKRLYSKSLKWCV